MKRKTNKGLVFAALTLVLLIAVSLLPRRFESLPKGFPLGLGGKKIAAFGEERYNAGSALLMDASTGRVLFIQNAEDRKPIASMVKIMTLLLVFEEIEKGALTTDQMITVSENAASMGGSQAFESGILMIQKTTVKALLTQKYT